MYIMYIMYIMSNCFFLPIYDPVLLTPRLLLAIGSSRGSARSYSHHMANDNRYRKSSDSSMYGAQCYIDDDLTIVPKLPVFIRKQETHIASQKNVPFIDDL